MKNVIFGALAALMPLGAMAATDADEDRMVINRLNATDFEVIQGTNYGAAEFWCGAATFIERRNRQSELTPIYVKRPRGPSLTVPGKKGVVFTVNADGLPPAGERLTRTVRDVGATLKSYQARGFCRDAFNRSTK